MWPTRYEQYRYLEYMLTLDEDRPRVVRVVEEAQRRVEEAARRLRHEALSC